MLTERSMLSRWAKKIEMNTTSSSKWDQLSITPLSPSPRIYPFQMLSVPLACESCPCSYIFINRNILNAKYSEKSPSSTENNHEAKRRRTERVRREKINSTVNKDLENRKRSRSNSHSDHIRRGRGRPKSASAKKHEEERGMNKSK